MSDFLAIVGIVACVFVLFVATELLASKHRRAEHKRRSDLATRAAALLDEADADMARFRAAIGMPALVLLLEVPLTPAEQIAQGWAARTNRGASA